MATEWTSDDIPTQSGRTVVVTGANSGIGYQAALQLARHGALVVMACRDLGRGKLARDRVAATCSDAALELRHLDLADLQSVRDFAAAVSAEHPRVDLLINNAGIMGVSRAVTTDGFEAHLGVNHLGHFALTGLLLPALLTSPDPRVVTVSSELRRMGRINFDDLQSVRRYRRWPAYAQSKLANLHFAAELDRRARRAGWALTSVAAHPGYAATGLLAGSAQFGRRTWLSRAAPLSKIFAQSAAQGAWPILYAATMPAVEGGDYFGPRSLGGMRGHPRRLALSWTALDHEVAQRLWALSSELTGVDFVA